MSAQLAKPIERYIVNLAEGRRLLAEAKTIQEAKLIRDAALAQADLLRSQKLSEESVKDAMELRLWAERRLGELLAEVVDHKGGRPKKNAVTMTAFPMAAFRKV